MAVLVFALSPYAVVRARVGRDDRATWCGSTCALVIAWAGLRVRSLVAIAVVAALATLVGLLAKEAALSIPARRDRRVGVHAREALAARRRSARGAAAALYLAVRLPAAARRLATQPRSTPPSVSNVPLRWLEYQVFPPMVRVIEAQARSPARASSTC